MILNVRMVMAVSGIALSEAIAMSEVLFAMVMTCARCVERFVDTNKGVSNDAGLRLVGAA